MINESSFFPYPDDPLDRALRNQRDCEGQKVDSRSILKRVHSRLYLTRNPESSSRSLKRWTISLAIAFSLFFVCFFLLPTPEVSAEEVLIQAKQAHQFSVDRAYQVRAELAPEIAKKFRGIEPKAEAILWTRGDRYCVVVNNETVYGQDEQARSWMKLNHEKGVRYDSDEIPDVIKDYLAIRSVRWVTLLDTVLKNCQLIREKSNSTFEHILAKPIKGKDRFLESAEIVIDPKTHLVHRLVLHRKLFGESIATISFEYQSQENKKPEYYHLETHLNPNGQVLDRTNPGLRRKEFLKHHIGLILDKSL